MVSPSSFGTDAFKCKRTSSSASAWDNLLHANLLVLDVVSRRARSIVLLPFICGPSPRRHRLKRYTPMWLKIEKGSRLSWGNNSGPYPTSYAIDVAWLERSANNVRKELHKLALWGVEGNVAAQLPEILLSLARAGFRLYGTLFQAIGNEQQVADDIRDWVAEQFALGDRVMRVTADPNIHVPWGLVFEQNPDGDNFAGHELESFADFWATKYSLSSTLSGYAYTRSKLVRRLDHARLLSLVNDVECNQIRNDTRAPLRDEFQQLVARPVGRGASAADCRSNIRGQGIGDTIVHVFGHQRNGVIDLGNGKQVDLFEFRDLLGEIVEQSGGPTNSQGLVILNACSGAYGDCDYSFVRIAEKTGLCGLIAAESAVPRDFAAMFALRFLKDLLAGGKSVGETMSELGRDKSMWPLSLLYGCYAQPDYRFVAG